LKPPISTLEVLIGGHNISADYEYLSGKHKPMKDKQAEAIVNFVASLERLRRRALQHMVDRLEWKNAIDEPMTVDDFFDPKNSIEIANMVDQLFDIAEEVRVSALEIEKNEDYLDLFTQKNDVLKFANQRLRSLCITFDLGFSELRPVHRVR
jgi:hypothetical protein